MSTTNNIVFTTLITKIRDLEAEDMRLDQDYSKNKRRIKADIENLKQAILLHKSSEPKSAKVVTTSNKPGRKAQEFDPLHYPYTGSVKNKILFAMNDLKRFLHIREIAEYIIDREPKHDKQILTDNLGRHAYKYRVDKVISSIKIGSSHRNTFYGLPEWVDEFGNAKEGYSYNSSALVDKPLGIDLPVLISLFNNK